MTVTDTPHPAFADIPMAHVVERITLGKAVRDPHHGPRGLLKFKHNPQLLVDVTIVPIVFTVMFASIFGGVIAGGVSDYLPILIPGVLVNVVTTSTVVVGIQLREDMDKGVFDRFVSLPIARIAPLSGSLVAANLRYLIAACLTLTVGLVMGYRRAASRGRWPRSCSSSSRRSR